MSSHAKLRWLSAFVPVFNALQQLALEPKHPLAGLNLVGTNKLKRKKKTCQEAPKISALTSTSGMAYGENSVSITVWSISPTGYEIKTSLY